jgi:asparagine synthase (glutamine-hydrolysing)
MCGIAGYVQRASSATSPIERMTARLAHRGPDGHGFHNQLSTDGQWQIALGHRRLSIIDLEGGKQPLCNEDATVWITFNGEIYNFQELHATLEQGGHRFATRCDTETIVHQYEQAGVSGLGALDGMFAFAVWDSRADRLLLARDRVGIKPLYYATLPDGGLAFASELTALLEHPQIDRALDPAGLASYFFADYAHAPGTMVRGVKKLEPGHYLTWSGGKLDSPRPFWTLNTEVTIDVPSRSTLVEDVRNKLRSAVAAQMVADVPVGVFLSGGIDSSLVAALAQIHAGGGLQSFSIAFEDPRFDESTYARRMAAHIGTRHVERTLAESEILTTLDAALDCLDEPMADPSILPTYLLSKLTAEHVKVVLSGDGGDELWAGYPTYKAHRYATVYAKLPASMRGGVIAPLVGRMPVRAGYQSLEWKAKRFALRWDDDPVRRHMRWMSNTDLPDLARCLPNGSPPPQFQHVDQCGSDQGGADRTAGGDLINRILALDFSQYLPGSVLAKVDRASMAHGLEVRPPMLHGELVDFAFSLPSSVKLRGRTTKAILKRAAVGLLPDEIIHRPKKGFAIPLAQWLNGPLAPRLEAVINDSPLWKTGLLCHGTFGAWKRQHRERLADRSKPLWALIVLDHWYRRVARSN